MFEHVGIVLIGRNEGDRLKACIRSAQSVQKIVYVDSASTDDSVEFAKSKGLTVVELDMSKPFSAGRARNEGFACLLGLYPDLQFVQFVDGDCEISEQWLAEAEAMLTAESDLAIVCGKRKERFPQSSVYNQLCDIEWDAPTGYVAACGGDFMIKVEVFLAVKGFDPSVIAGEEPEMCFRIRAINWKIKRVNIPMTLHDANMHHLSQWWKRNLRSGHAYAQGMALHGDSEERFNVKQVRSILIFGGLFPVIFLVSLLVSYFLLSWMVILVLGFLFVKIVRYAVVEKKLNFKLSFLYGFSIILGKIPQSFGVLKFIFNTKTNQKAVIIEYK